MILSKDIKPEHQIYTGGALLISTLHNLPYKEIDITTLFEISNKGNDFSVNSLLLALDWLFLLEAVEQKEGKIIKCF